MSRAAEHEPPKVVQEAVVQEEQAEQHQRFRRLKELHAKAHSNPVSSFLTKVFLTLVGLVLILAGIVMLVGPGQGVLAILLGLGVLALEWPWAERLLHRLRERIHQARERAALVDPKVRRRRALLTALAVLVVCGLLAWLVHRFGWPSATVSSWRWLQGFVGFLPDLPGM
jgi:uncharacterized protein (TIGR02611 family)